VAVVAEAMVAHNKMVTTVDLAEVVQINLTLQTRELVEMEQLDREISVVTRVAAVVVKFPVAEAEAQVVLVQVVVQVAVVLAQIDLSIREQVVMEFKTRFLEQPCGMQAVAVAVVLVETVRLDLI
jgi:hypothetical protein